MRTYNIKNKKQGFTLVEVMLVIGLIGILAGMIIVAINPVRQFKVARDTERQTHILAIMNAVNANMSEHSGIFTCMGTPRDLPTTTLAIIGSDAGALDIRDCLVPMYLGEIPKDPKIGRPYNSSTGYSTGYALGISSTTGSLIIEAQGELQSRITVGQ